MSLNAMKFDQLSTLGMAQFKSINMKKLKQLDGNEIDELFKIINELDLDELSAEQRFTLTRLVHFISTIGGDSYDRHFIHAQGNIRIMINEPEEKSDIKLYRGSKKAYNYSIGQKIDFGNRSFSEGLSVAKTFAGPTVFHVEGVFYRINFKNDSMFANELESRIKRGTTGVVRGKDVDAKGVVHYLVVIEQHPDEQKYDENVTGTANTHMTVATGDDPNGDHPGHPSIISTYLS